MNVILATAFSLTLGIWRVRVRVAVEDASLPCRDAYDDDAT